MNMNSTTQRITLATAGAGLLLLITWYFLLWSPQGHKLAAARQAHATAEAKVSQLHAQISGLHALERQIPADKLKLAQYTAAIPDNPQLADSLHEVQAAASSSGVTMSAISPSGNPATSTVSTGQAASTVPSVAFSISASGSYQQLMTFLSSLNHMPRTLVVKSLSLSGGSGANQSLTASISADVFYAGQPNS